jgi:hypothetical protein
MTLRARLTGASAFRAALDRIADAGTLRGELTAAAEEVRIAAHRRLEEADPPGGKGKALARSLSIRLDRDGAAAEIGTALDHGWHREFGSVAHPPRPWLGPSFAEARPAILARLRSWLGAASKRARG